MKLASILLLCFLFLFSMALAAEFPTHTPNGILIDRVLPLAHIEDLDGSQDTPAVGFSRWQQALHELSRSAESPLGWPSGRELAQRAKQSPKMNLAVLWARYDQLDTQNETTSSLAFAFTGLKMESHHGQDLVFHLPASSIFKSAPGQIKHWLFDADDGQGWRPLLLGQDLPVSYSSIGLKTMRLQAVLTDSTHLHATAILDVKALVTPQPTETWSITASEVYDGIAGSGQAYVYLADGHSQLTNPVVVVEGFDLDNSMDWPVLYALLNQENMLDDLRAQGFDAVVLDFTEATSPIQRNAFVLTELLQRVQTATDGETSVALIGASMGGLVSRYGLTWMENQGQEHHVRTFISFDSPQNGANIPLGLQHWLNFFRDESADALYLLSRLSQPAALQMLMYHYSHSPQNSPGPHSLYQSFRDDLANLGNWPELPRLVGVANGSGQSIGQGFDAGEKIIHYEYRSLLVDINGNVWAVPQNNSQLIFQGLIDVIWPLPDTQQDVSVNAALPWDNAPGGTRGSMAQMGDTQAPYGDIVALHDNHCFIPTISALALDVLDPFFEVASTPDLLGMTPFDAVYYPAENQGHIFISPESKSFLMDEILSNPSPVSDAPALAAVLHQATPNPFNAQTRLGFSLQQEALVDLTIYDLAGRLVRTLLSGASRKAGNHSILWNGMSDGGQIQPSGLYFYRLVTPDQALVGSMSMVK